MTERKHPLAECESCPWADCGVVYSAGPSDAKIAVVGEAPGRKEVEGGIPFTGPSGQLLDKVLAHNGIERKGVFVTNATLCHPPFKAGTKPTEPPKEALQACAPRLKAELQSLSELETLVLLGNTATKQVLKVKEGITQVRVGPPKESPDYPGVSIIPTIHPAACLRHSDSFPSLAADIRKIKERDIWVKFEPPTYRIFDDEADALAAVNELANSNYDPITCDIEAGLEKEFNIPKVHLLCIGFGYKPNTSIVIGEKALGFASVVEALRRLFKRKRIICHNGKFDIAHLMKLGFLDDPYCLWGDTMLASYSLDERQGVHGLKYIASEMLGAPHYDQEKDKYLDSKSSSYANIPRRILYPYNAWDAALTYNIWERFVPRMAEQDVRRVHDRLVRYSHELIYVEADGVGFDLEYNEYLYNHFEELLAPLEEALTPWVANPRSPMQVKEALHKLNVRVADTQADTLEVALRSIKPGTEANEFILKLLEHRDYQKSYSTYVKGFRKRVINGRIYSTFTLHGTVTGRTSSRNPNLQNVTRGVTLRKQFIPATGYVYVQCDYGQIEMRIAAIEAARLLGLDTTYLLDLLADPTRDIFDEIGTRLYGSLAAAQLKVNRVRTKAYAYGTNYGREAYSIAQEYNVSQLEAQKGQDLYFALAPELIKWQEHTKQAVRQGPIITPFGRRRRFGLLTRENIRDVEKEAIAMVPQSTANDINLSALCNIRKAGMHPRIPVHDSIMCEELEEHKMDVARDMVKIMVDTAREEYTDRIPFPADYEFGLNWGELSKE